jgi:hypothetical protein
MKQAAQTPLTYTVAAQTPSVLDPTTLSSILQYGGSAAAIILATAVLLLAVAEIIKVLVPVMLQQSNRKPKRH